MQKGVRKPKTSLHHGKRLDRKIHDIFKSNISAEPSERLDSLPQRLDHSCDHWQE